MNLNVLKWHARKLRPLLRPICWLGKHKRGVLKHNFPAPGTAVEQDVRLKYFECPRCLRETRYLDKPKPLPQTSPADGSEHYAAPPSSTSWTTIATPSPHSAAKAHHAEELKKLRGEA